MYRRIGNLVFLVGLKGTKQEVGDIQTIEEGRGCGRIVVSDTSPLISLLKIDRIDMLEKLFGQVLIPQAQQAETQFTYRLVAPVFTPGEMDQLHYAVPQPERSKSVGKYRRAAKKGVQTIE